VRYTRNYSSCSRIIITLLGKSFNNWFKNGGILYIIEDDIDYHKNYEIFYSVYYNNIFIYYF